MILLVCGLSIALGIGCSEATTFGCSNTKLTDQVRQLFFDAHNNARRNLAKGLEPNKCGNLSSGSNVYELRWDCDMETAAENWSNTCQSTTQNIDSSWAHNRATTTSTNPLTGIAFVLDFWWSNVRSVGLTDPDNRYTTSSLYSFTNMAHGKSTAFACSYALCSGQLRVNCFYNRIGYYTNGIIYENGPACSTSADCTTHEDSTCNDGLCYQPKPAPIVETYEMCPGRTDISDQARMKFLDWHNILRSRLAKGTEKDGPSGTVFAPQAKQMIKMRYNCDVERTAKLWADYCLWEHSTHAFRENRGESMYYTTRLNYNKILTGEAASKAWWSELEEFGVGEENILTAEIFAKGVGHYTQMAWENSTELGCSVAYCSDKTLTVCQYDPPGNYFNRLIYTKGAPCTSNADCPGAQTCSVSEALCVLP